MQASNFVPPIIDMPWTSEEHNLFLQGYLLYGNSWVQIAEVIRSRNAYQVCSYATWLESHGCLPQLPPIQSTTPIAAAPIQVAKPKAQPPQPQQNGEKNKGVWSKEEHELFLEGLQKYGKGSWSAIAKLVGTRTSPQVITHARTYLKKLENGNDSVSGKKRKASEDEKPKAKKKAATSPKKSPTKSSSKSLPRSPKAEAKPSASKTPQVPSGVSVKAPNPVQSDATPEPPNKSKGDSTLDIHPPSIKSEDVGEGVVSPPVKKIKALGGGDETTPKQNSIEPANSSPQVVSDHEELRVAPPLYKFDSSMKIPLIAVGLLVSILLAGTIFVYMGPEVGGISYDENPLDL